MYNFLHKEQVYKLCYQLLNFFKPKLLKLYLKYMEYFKGQHSLVFIQVLLSKTPFQAILYSIPDVDTDDNYINLIAKLRQERFQSISNSIVS